MTKDWTTAKVIAIKEATPKIRLFTIELPDIVEFESGQFLTLDLSIPSDEKKVLRSYSVASYADNTNRLELAIGLVEGGIGTTRIFNDWREGTAILLRGFFGKFTIPKDLAKEWFFICTGTGIVPFKSMLDYIERNNLQTPKIHLIYGSRYLEDLAYHTDLEALSNKLPNMSYYPVLSREENSTCHKGYVHSVYSDICKSKPEALFMLCGIGSMINEAQDNIISLGYTKDSIHFEKY